MIAKIKFSGKDKKQFRFVLVAKNSEPIATSEQYKSKQSVQKTLKKYFPTFVIQDETKPTKKK